jgi:Glycosyl transferase family 2
VELRVRVHLLRGRVRHVHGPTTVAYDDDELLVICVVRNGEEYVQPFMAHYRALGARHLVFLDNGSTDGTVDRLRRFDDVTVLETDAPYERYENTMKRYLAERFSAGRWNLIADIDELFDFPYSDRIGLRDFLRYLNRHEYTAVAAQMLDMFADRPLNASPVEGGEDLTSTYRFYDISEIVTRQHRLLDVGNFGIRFHQGGIRRKVFGTLNGLTKAALVRMDGRVQPFVGWHHVRNARFADVSCVLRHYPFGPSFYRKVQDAVETGRYGPVTSDEYAAYWAVLSRQPDVNLRLETAREWSSLEELIEAGFLVVSPAYRRWVADHVRAT